MEIINFMIVTHKHTTIYFYFYTQVTRSYHRKYLNFSMYFHFYVLVLEYLIHRHVRSPSLSFDVCVS